MYKTSDLYFAAYLKVAQVPLMGIERQGNKVIFLFEETDPGVLRQLKDQFFTDQAKVPALSYAQALKVMKAIIHNPEMGV